MAGRWWLVTGSVICTVQYSTVQYSTPDTQQWAPPHRGKTNKVYQILQFFTQLLVRNPSSCEIYFFGIKKHQVLWSPYKCSEWLWEISRLWSKTGLAGTSACHAATQRHTAGTPTKKIIWHQQKENNLMTFGFWFYRNKQVTKNDSIYFS